MSECQIGCITSDDEGRGYYCEECPERRKGDASTLVGPDGFTRLEPATSEVQWNALEMADERCVVCGREAPLHGGLCCFHKYDEQPLCIHCATDEDPACEHDWLDRPESDTRECLICGVER